MPQYKHEWNQSENQRFAKACSEAGLSDSEADRFSDEYHKMPNRERMEFRDIVAAAKEWQSNSGGGFRRSDRR